MDTPRAMHVRSEPRGDASVVTDSVTLGAVERWALDRVRRYGLRAFVVRASLVAIVASAVLTAIGLIPMGAYGSASDWIPALAMGFVVPALVAPPMLWFSLRLVVRLDVAMALVERSSVTDHLTGVLNRRGFFRELERCEDSTSTWRLAMVDLDDFKQLNDRHGHGLGDAALRHVAQWLITQIGEDGRVGRLGGDEFALVVDAASGPLPTRQRFEIDGVAFTASIGQALTDDEVDLASALAVADIALYAAKAESHT